MEKLESDFQKHKKKEKGERLIQSQRESIDKFVKKKPKASSDNQLVEVGFNHCT
jgi:hypothetical protein